MKEERGIIGGWEAPCVPFDYEKMEREAQRECDILKQRLDALKRERVEDADREFLRRREICMLTDIYYEQRHQTRLFHKRAQGRKGATCHFPSGVL